MNRDQARKEEKKQSKEGNQTLDIVIDPPLVPDGLQFRIPATTKVDGKQVTLALATVVMPLIYEEKPYTDKPGFVIKFNKDTERKVVGFDKEECLIMDISTQEPFRKKGIGRVLTEHLKTFFNRMVTGARSEEGGRLMENCGFKKTKLGQLIWKKEEDEKPDNTILR